MRPSTRTRPVDPVAKAKRVRTRYGVTPDQFARLVEAAGGVCQSCGAPSDDLCLDVRARDQSVRGMVCRRCIFVLGHVHRDAGRLERIAAYLRANQV